MKLIFIRHAEPDYINDSITEKGRNEALLLSKRIKDWHVTKCYVSPQGRAKATAEPSLKELGMEAEVIPFLHEYAHNVTHPLTGRTGVPWDFVASDWTKYDCNFDLEDGFLNYPCMKTNPDVASNYSIVTEGFDDILKQYGYTREGRFYRYDKAVKRNLISTVGPNHEVRNNSPYKNENDEPVLLFFCHLGVTMLILSHLVNIPFQTLTHGFFLPPTSLTIVSSEERWDDEAYFRIQAMGDCAHLLTGKEPISPAGSFTGPFQG
ncbi:MAG: histidine phosphatase family protein [Lachnospiraceae bacterium]|nr:histidine phosphatase family protein [Lachnospiraceae bacterium]